MVKVLVNGYGTIGKRVAWALRRQSDLTLYGVVKRRPDYSAILAVKSGIDVYVPGEEELRAFEESRVRVAGLLDDALRRVDAVVDATPGGVGRRYKGLYVKHGVKAVFQGGEAPDVAQVSFNSLCNYSEALGKDFIRVVSCNTTALLRLICSLNRYFTVDRVRAVIVRRGADPKEVRRGPINAIVLNPPKLPSHHGVDVKTVLPWLDIQTAAFAVPTTLMHTHFIQVFLKEGVTREDVVRVLEGSPRIVLVGAEALGVSSTAELAEVIRDMGRARGDMYELAVWEESVTVIDGREVMLTQSVHQESIVVPENVDALRAALSIEEDGDRSINITDTALGLVRGWLLWSS